MSQSLSLRILSLEDSEFDAELIKRELQRGRFAFQFTRVQTEREFEQQLADYQPELILADYKLPNFSGGRALQISRQRCPEVPVIMISGTVGEETAVELLKNGATDFVLKERLSRLVPAVQRALREVAERQARQQAELELRLLNEQLEVRVNERTRELSEKNALMEEDLRMARELQMALLPHHFPTLPRSVEQAASAVKFSSLFQPSSSVSGDFFNITRVSETAVGVFVCDVMGHGVRAALVTAMMRALEEQLRDSADQPGRLLTEINRAMRGMLRQSGTTLFTTACYLVADLTSAQISFANAGHPSPLLVRHPQEFLRSEPTIESITSRETSGPALGLFENVRYRTHQLPLAAEDLLLFFTDGLFEAENSNDEAFSESRLREVIRSRSDLPMPRLLEEIFAEVERFAKGRDFSDDICLIGMEIDHLQASAA